MAKRLYTEEQKEKRRKAKREWYQKNKQHVKEYNKTYSKNYRIENEDTIKKKKKEYCDSHKNEKSEYMKNYYNTQIGRASNLASSYKQDDKRNNRGKCTLSKEWIVDNIFSKPCFYCGESDWHKLGCDRINNDLPHTPDNVVPCCWECNIKRKTTDFEEFLKANEAHV